MALDGRPSKISDGARSGAPRRRGGSFRSAFASQARGETGRAIEEYEAAVAVDPKWERARVNLIALYCGERQWTKAEKHFQTLVDLGLRVAEGHYDFGVCLAAQGETSRAAGEFRSALEINAQYAQAWLAQGQLAEGEGGALSTAQPPVSQ